MNVVCRIIIHAVLDYLWFVSGLCFVCMMDKNLAAIVVAVLRNLQFLSTRATVAMSRSMDGKNEDTHRVSIYTHT